MPFPSVSSPPASAASSAVAEGRAKSATMTAYQYPGVKTNGNSSTSGLASNRAQYEVMRVYKAQTIDQLIVEVTTAVAGSTVRASIYAADANYQPGALVADSGAIDSATTGVKAVTPVGGAVTLQPGLYVRCINASAAGIAVRTFQIASNEFGIGTNMQPIGQMYVTQAYGAPPDPGPAWDTIANGTPACFIIVRESVA